VTHLRPLHRRRDAADAADDATAEAATSDGTVQRYDLAGDLGGLLRPTWNADGTLLVEGRIARPGILRYTDDDGGVFRELIPEEELHRADSLGTLGRVAVTLEHPEEDVTPDNFERLAVGDVDGVVDATEAGGFVRVKMAVRRRDAQDAIADGKIELSPGYRCRIDATPGIHPKFGPYDAVQRGRIYNHVAIVDRARGGSQIRLRTDGAARQLPATNRQDREDTVNPRLLALLALLGADPTRFDSDDAGLAEIDRRARDLTAKAEAAEAKADAMPPDFEKFKKKKEDEIEALKKDNERLKGQLAAVTSVADAFRAKADADEIAGLIETGKRIDGFDASKIADDAKVADVRLAVARAHLGADKVADDASEDYVRGILAMIPAKADSADEVIDPWRPPTDDSKPAAKRGDADDTGAKSPSQAYYDRADKAFNTAKAGGAV
jgi:hypothetical protein